mgnify:CR=1 FL=1
MSANAQTLAERTHPDSPFASLYEERGVSSTAAAINPSRGRPPSVALKDAALRVNKYSDCARFTNNDKTRAIQKGGI